MTNSQVAASIGLAAIGVLPYIRLFFRDVALEPPPREYVLFARWWCALWCSPMVLNLLLTALP